MPDGPVATPDLRPLTTSELIDRGFLLYRQHFIGLFLLALLCQIAPFATSQPLITALRLMPSQGDWTTSPRIALPRAGLLLFVWIVGQLITFCFEVAITFYLSEAYLGRVPSIKAGLRRLGSCLAGSIRTCLLNVFLVGLSFIFPVLALAAITLYGQLHPPQQFSTLIFFLVGALILLVASVVPVLIIFMRLMVTVPAVALEGLAGWRAVKRSSALVRYDPGLGMMYWGEMRLSLLLLPLFVIELLALSLTSLPVTFHAIDQMLRHGAIGQVATPPDAALIISQILVLLTGALLLPLYLIATTLFYYDVRIRREGFDLDLATAQVGAAP